MHTKKEQLLQPHVKYKTNSKILTDKNSLDGIIMQISCKITQKKNYR